MGSSLIDSASKRPALTLSPLFLFHIESWDGLPRPDKKSTAWSSRRTGTPNWSRRARRTLSHCSSA